MAVETTVPSLREEIEELIAGNQAGAAAQQLTKLWRVENNPAAAAFVVSRFEKLRGQVPLTSFKLAILRSFTVEPVLPLLRASAFSSGIDLTVHTGDFNAYAQEILDSDSSLYHQRPDTVILAVQTVDVAPDLWRDF